MPNQAQERKKALREAARDIRVEAVAKRLREAFDYCGGVAEVSERTGIPRKTLHNFVSKTPTEPGIADLALIAEHTDHDLNWLSGLTDLRHPEIDPASGGFLAHVPDVAEFSFVPRYDVRASAGHGAVVPFEDIDGGRQFMAFRTEWLRRIGVQPSSAEVLVAVGDSMEPTIRDGDLILIDRSIKQVVDDGIYVLVLGGMVLLKRLQNRRDSSVVLKSDNPQYDDEVVPAGEVSDLRIEGRVRWFGRTL